MDRSIVESPTMPIAMRTAATATDIRDILTAILNLFWSLDESVAGHRYAAPISVLAVTPAIIDPSSPPAIENDLSAAVNIPNRGYSAVLMVA